MFGSRRATQLETNMQAAKGYVCYECGCEVPMDGQACQRCRTDLRERITNKTIKLAYDMAPRSVRFVNAKMPGNSRPEEMVRLLEESGVDLGSAKVLIDVGAGPNLVRHATPTKYPNLKDYAKYETSLINSRRAARAHKKN